MDAKQQVNTEFQKYIRTFLKEDFVLIDVGCAGGIEWSWPEVFKDKLQATGFDSNIDSIKILNEKNSNPKIQYVEGQISVQTPAKQDSLYLNSSTSAKDQKIWQDVYGPLPLTWYRSSAAKAREILSKDVQNLAAEDAIERSLQVLMKSSMQEIDLSEYIDDTCNSGLDFIKIDIDSQDFEVLKSIREHLKRHDVLGVVIEVNYESSVNRFSDVDLFLKELDFELCDLGTRRYDSMHLPGRFALKMAAQTIDGRLLQGDALYLRDIYALNLTKNKTYPLAKLIKLVLLYDMFCMSSWAAEILIHFKDTLVRAGIDVDHSLDLLTSDMIERSAFNFKDCDGNSNNKISYKELIKKFNNDHQSFLLDKNILSLDAKHSGLIERLRKKFASLIQ